MKKNLATILLIAMTFVNLTLSLVLVIAVVPTAVKTNTAITSVVKILDLELESTEPTPELTVDDIEPYTFENDFTVNLAKSAGDSSSHYALFSVSLSLNKTSDDYATKYDLIATYETRIREIVSDEFGKYTKDTVQENKEAIKAAVLATLSEELDTDFIVGISFGGLLTQ